MPRIMSFGCDADRFLHEPPAPLAGLRTLRALPACSRAVFCCFVSASSSTSSEAISASLTPPSGFSRRRAGPCVSSGTTPTPSPRARSRASSQRDVAREDHDGRTGVAVDLRGDRSEAGESVAAREPPPRRPRTSRARPRHPPRCRPAGRSRPARSGHPRGGVPDSLPFSLPISATMSLSDALTVPSRFATPLRAARRRSRRRPAPIRRAARRATR